MKYKKLPFFLIVFLQLSAFSLFGQQSLLGKRITENYVEKPLLDVIHHLQSKYHIPFSYSSNRFFLNKKINQSFKEETLEKVLEKLLQGTGAVFKIVDGFVILSLDAVEANLISQTVRGVVKDKITKLPLVGATVRISGEGKEYGTVTNLRGYFEIPKVSVGRKNIEATYLGYDPLKIEEYVITSGKEVVLDLELSESLIALQELVVTAPDFSKHKPTNEMALVSARSFTPEETSRYPGSFLDPARMALAYAGVSIYDDLSNDMIIRGNTSKGLLWKIEGIEAPNPNHFFEEGSTSGAISMLSNNVLANSDFYTSAFPAEYGNALSGVFDLKFRKGNDQKREYALSTGFLGTEAGIEGPFSKKSKASYLANYRYSTLGILQKGGIDFGSISIANFQDLSFNIHFPIKQNSLSIFGLGGASRGGEDAEKDTALSKFIYYKLNDVSKYKAGMVGLKYNYSVSSNTFSENVISFSGYKITSKIDTFDINGEPDLIDADTFINQAIRFSSSLTHKINFRSTLKSGIVFSHIGFNYRSYRQNEEGEVVNYLQGKGTSQLFQAFTQWKYDLSLDLQLNTGVHFTYFHLSKDASVEPRISLKYRLNSGQSLNAGWGIHSKAEPLVTYFSLKEIDDTKVASPNKNLKLTKAQHFVLGYDHSFDQFIRMKLETYYQYLYNVPVYSDSNMIVSTLNSSTGYTVYQRGVDTLKNAGTGRNYGIEFTLEKFFSNQYYFLTTATLYQSKFSVDKKAEYNSQFNGNFALNLLGGKEFKVGSEGKNVIGVNAKIIWQGGKRYTPVDMEKSIELGDTYLIKERTNELITENYFRIDFSAYYKLNRPKTTHSFYIDIQNVTNKYNARGYLYDRNTHTIQKLYFNGILPNAYYKIQF